MLEVVTSPSEASKRFEVVERKGLGHPDSICDALAENLSRALCREYRARFGEILHYNVDKALLRGGRSSPAFGGGSIKEPIQVYLAGRAATGLRNEALPIEELAVEGSKAWLRANFHAMDVDRDVVILPLVREGSQDLQTLYSRHGRMGIPFANDTSFGVGYAPLSAIERLVLAIDKSIQSRDRPTDRPAWGEDLKIMVIRRGEAVHVTIACAMIGRYLRGIEDYLDHKTALQSLVQSAAAQYGFHDCQVDVNAADDLRSCSVYLTVTGSSAEAGDDGQVGRGNGVNGLITPCRPMSLEAAAGKNPVSHVGKIYNIVAKEVAEKLVAECPDLAYAECLLVGKIGAPISSPAVVHVKLRSYTGAPISSFDEAVHEIVARQLADLPGVVSRLSAGELQVF